MLADYVRRSHQSDLSKTSKHWDIFLSHCTAVTSQFKPQKNTFNNVNDSQKQSQNDGGEVGGVWEVRQRHHVLVASRNQAIKTKALRH